MALIGPEVILDWTDGLTTPALHKKAKATDKPMFSVTSLVTHEKMKSKEMAAIQAGIDEAATARFGRESYAEMIEERRFESPLHRDIGSKGYDKKVFAVRISSKSGQDHPPLLLDARNRVSDGKGGTKPGPVTDKREWYSGVKARVSYTFRAYGGLNTGYDPGVALDLRNVCKIGDGPRLTRNANADEMDGVDALPEDPADAANDMASLLE